MTAPVDRADADQAWVAGRITAQRWSDGAVEPVTRAFPEEVPVAVVVNDENYAVMLASPADTEDFAYGFLRSEGVIRHPDEVDSVIRHLRPEGHVVEVRLIGEMPASARRERRLAGVSSCGLCGVESLRDAIKPLGRVPDGPAFDGNAVLRAMAGLRDHQPFNAVAGAMHAAAFAGPDGMLRTAREDVGRHNALDKLIGALLRERVDPASGFVVMSSRCSYELVQKASAFGLRLLCTASAPTALAVRLAREANITLACLVRDGGFLLMTGAERMQMREVIANG